MKVVWTLKALTDAFEQVKAEGVVDRINAVYDKKFGR